MLEHGGNLGAAAQKFGITFADWIDLSTGINPDAYPVPLIDPACWKRLPENGDGLEAAAAAYYGTPRLLTVPGAQAAVQALPALFAPVVVACLTPIYAEHPQAWERAGHKLRRLPTLERAMAAATPNVLLCNPNNPTASALARGALLDAVAQLKQRGGWLIVDEAFVDPTPESSITTLAGSDEAPNLIVLRSLSKFFGLAGARVGFAFGATEKLDQLRELIGPWPVAHPSRAVARHALADVAWQDAMREKLGAQSQRLAETLAPLGEVTRTALFCSVKTPAAEALFEHFARRAILTRHFAQHGLLRFGLPGDEAQWQRLESAISERA